MLTIYREQLNHLNKLQEKRLLVSITAHIEHYFPAEWAQLKGDNRAGIINDAIEQGRSFGLSTDRNLTIYTDFVVSFGSGFPANQPWAKAILDEPGRTEDQKVDDLLDELDENVGDTE